MTAPVNAMRVAVERLVPALARRRHYFNLNNTMVRLECLLSDVASDTVARTLDAAASPASAATRWAHAK
jgi:hypothetical protein